MQARPHILIVEADTIRQNRINRWCLTNGYATTAVHHPRQALAAAASNGFVAAIVNQSLHEYSGIETSKQLKQQIANLKVLLLSCDPNGISHFEAIGAGIDSFVYLPSHLELIGAKLNLMLRASTKRSRKQKRLLSAQQRTSISNTDRQVEAPALRHTALELSPSPPTVARRLHIR